MEENPRDDNAYQKEAQAYLARIRRTISESEALIAQAELRMAETDRFLESQGLTRAQVEAMNFTEDQLKAVNAELVMRGLPPLEEIAPSYDAASNDNASSDNASDEQLTGAGRNATPDPEAGDVDGDLENRRRKFSAMMGNFRL